MIPPWARANIRELIASNHELDNNVCRPVEMEALYNIERQAHAIRKFGICLELPPLQVRILKLERAALRYHRNLSFDERLEYIAVNAMDGRFRTLLPFSEREIMSLLEQVDEVLALRELLGMPPQFADFGEFEAKRFYKKFVEGKSSAVRKAAKAA